MRDRDNAQREWRRDRRVLGAVLLCLAAGAALAFVRPGTVTAAGRPWIEVTSPNFVVASDAGEKTARRVAWQFEQVRAVIQKLWPWARLSAGRPFLVMAARNEASLKSLAPMYWEQPRGLRPSSVFVTGRDRHYVALRTDIDTPDNLQANPYFSTHWAYVHIVLHANVARPMPQWFSRGMSSLFANTIVRDKDVLVGMIVPWYLEELRQTRVLPLATLLSVDGQSPYRTREADSRAFDASAWALMHYLSFGEQGTNLARFNRFFERFMASGDAAGALGEVYGGVAALEMALRHYTERMLFTYQRAAIDVDVTEKSFASRALSEPESAALRAGLHAAMNRPVEARTSADLAVRLGADLAAPHDADGLVHDMDGNREKAIEAFARAIERGSSNYHTYYRHAQLLWRAGVDPETLGRIARSLERSVTLNDRHAAGYSYLADVKVDLNETEAALGLARRAVSLEPGVSYHRVTLARVLSRLAQHAEAMQEAQRGLALASDAAERQRAESLIAHLERQRK